MAQYERYAELRDQAGLTDYAVAKRADIVASTLSDWKSGRSVPKLQKLTRIAEAINVKLEDLIEEVDAG